MSLQLETTVETVEGFEVVNAYGRVAVADQQQGTFLQSQVVLYKSEADYLAGKQYANVQGISFQITAPYNRDTDGTDILNLAHDYLIAELAAQGIVAVKMLTAE